MISKEIVKEAVRILDNKKAKDIVALEVGKLTSLGDNFIIASGNSKTQVKALADEVVIKLKEKGVELSYPQQGDKGASWILLDYGDVMIHIFHHETRGFYALEQLWGDATNLNIDEMLEG